MENHRFILSNVEGAGAGYDSKLDLLVQDADTDEILDRKEIELKVELDEWFWGERRDNKMIGEITFFGEGKG